MNHQKGFTLAQLAVVLFFVSLWALIIYTVAHFVIKFW